MKDQEKIIEARIAILKDKVADLAGTFDKMNNKMFALVGLLLTVGGLLSYDAFKINSPDTVVEFIIFVSALALLGLTVIIIGFDYRVKRNWDVPIGPVEEEKLNNSKKYIEALEIIHLDYQIVYEGRNNTLGRKAKILNGALYMFIASAILLIVLKIGG